MTLAEAAEKYLAANPARQGRRWDNRAHYVSMFTLAHGDRILEDFPRAAAFAWRDELAASYKPNTVRLALAYAAHLFNWCVEREMCAVSPFRAVRRPRPQRRKRHLTAEEYTRLQAALQGDPGPFGPAVTLALHCLFRKGELLAIRRAHVQLGLGHRGAIYLPDSKNGEDGLIPLNESARAAVDALLALPGEPDGPLVPYSISQFERRWAKARKAAGLTDVWVHDLRRSGASFLIQNGTPIAQVQEALRDRDINVTRRNYAHLRLQDVALELDRMDLRLRESAPATAQVPGP